jgi:hypothetical protein
MASSTCSMCPAASSGRTTCAIRATRPKATGSSSNRCTVDPEGREACTLVLSGVRSIFASLGKILMEARTFAKCLLPRSHGPVYPHFTQRYGRPNILHFSQRQIVTSPQLGHGNFTAPSPGKIVRAHQEHVGIRMTFSLTVAVVLITYTSKADTKRVKVIN